MNLLMSKFISPNLTGAIFRERLHPLVKEISAKKLTIVTAGAGYGKSVFVAQAMTQFGIKNSWYRIDTSDNEFNNFIAYFIAGIREHYPLFFDDQYDISVKDPEIILSQFLIEIEKTLTEDLFFVFDNFRIIQNNEKINIFLQLLLARLPSFLHVILISRTEINLQISRLIAQREVAQVTEVDLAFTKAEINTFFTQVFAIQIDKNNSENLFKKTGGWVSGLILFHNDIKKNNGIDIEQSILSFKGSHKSIFKYLEENVYNQLTDTEKQFVMKTSILSEIDVDFCNQILKKENSYAILCKLEDNHIFTFSLDEERKSFYYHYLFQEFLQKKLKIELSKNEIDNLYNDTALLYEKGDKGEEALKHHILAGNIDDVSRLLPGLARPIIKQGCPDVVQSLLLSIPKHSMDNEPWFQYLQAGYFELTSQVQLALKGYEKVLKIFRSRKDQEGECICLMELAEHYVTSGDLKRAELEYKKIIIINQLDPFLSIITLGHLIKVLGLSGKTKEADKYAKKAVTLLSYLNDEKSLKMCKGWIAVARGYRYVFSGNYHKAIKHGENSISLFKDIGEFKLMFASYFILSTSCFYLGLFSKGMQAAQEGVKIAKDNFLLSGDYAEFLCLLREKNNLAMEDLTKEQLLISLENCQNCLKSFQDISFIGGIAQTFLVLHTAHLKMGEVTKAEKSLRNGIEIVKDHNMPLIENELKLSLSQLLFFRKGDEHKREAMMLLKDAEKAFAAPGWHMCWVAKVYARYYWSYGHFETVFWYIEAWLKTSEIKQYDAWIVSEKDWIIPLLVELFAMGDMKEYIKEIFIKIGPFAEIHLTSLMKNKNPTISRAAAKLLNLIPMPSLPSICAYFFKQFKVFIGDKIVEEKQWKSKKAKTIFKYLLCNRNKGYLDKEILMELLWPNEDPKKSAQRFHVALASLRKTLEPDLPKGVRSSYINRSGHAYSINIGDSGVIDSEEFLKEIEIAQNERDSNKALDHYKKSESIYQGDFLEEDLYEDWCAEEREKYKENYLFILTKIIECHEATKNYAGCISAANNYLKTDKFAENIIRLLMNYYSLTGNTVLAIKIYEKSKKTIKKELCCDLSDETEVLYKQLISA
ncbi:MAG: hypothetical protein GY707_02545 [Desulfobacteraceae bacterium]|nr:hypothetical protein [Desulfobacteraceae bacterium]